MSGLKLLQMTVIGEGPLQTRDVLCPLRTARCMWRRRGTTGGSAKAISRRIPSRQVCSLLLLGKPLEPRMAEHV